MSKHVAAVMLVSREIWSCSSRHSVTFFEDRLPGDSNLNLNVNVPVNSRSASRSRSNTHGSSSQDHTSQGGLPPEGLLEHACKAPKHLKAPKLPGFGEASGSCGHSGGLGVIRGAGGFSQLRGVAVLGLWGSGGPGGLGVPRGAGGFSGPWGLEALGGGGGGGVLEA